MDTEEREQLGSDPARRIFEKVGGWPVLCDEDDDDDDGDEQDANSTRRKRDTEVEEEGMIDVVNEDADVVEKVEENETEKKAETKSALNRQQTNAHYNQEEDEQ